MYGGSLLGHQGPMLKLGQLWPCCHGIVSSRSMGGCKRCSWHWLRRGASSNNVKIVTP
jgi:hypothetical protein